MTIQLWVHSNNKLIHLIAEQKQNLLQLLNSHNFQLSSPCGGNIACGKCKVKLIAGEYPLSDSELDLLTEKEIENGYRLACAINLMDDTTIEIVEEGELQVLTQGIPFSIDFDPVVHLHRWNYQNNKKEYYDTYLELLYKYTKTNRISLPIIQKLAGITKSQDIFALSYNNKIIDLDNRPITKVYGLAVDIGTTTIVVYLLNLLTGEEVDLESLTNPQRRFGADVISRITYIQSSRGSVEEVQQALIKGLNQTIAILIERNKLNRNNIYLMSAVGNTIMLHFFLGISPQIIAKAPYKPIFTEQMEVIADSLNLDINPQGIVQILPAVSAYIGSDIIADLLVADFDSEEWNLLIDVGTNGEIVLGNSQDILACSAAAGPAFEGAKISFGMAGVTGAISQFSISDDKQFEYKTVGSGKAIGICGSGLIDIIAEMINNNILTNTGLFNDQIDEAFNKHLTTYKNMKALRIVDSKVEAINKSIYLTQKDVRELQLAKGAIAAGINILLKEAGIRYENLKNIYLAGGFGSYINPESACKIGLLPQGMQEKIIKLGNGAGLGARAYILDRKQVKKVKNLIDKMEYLELSLRKDFQDEFIRSLDF